MKFMDKTREAFHHNVSLVQNKTGLSERLMKVYFILSVSIIISTMFMKNKLSKRIKMINELYEREKGKDE